uniref:Stress response protein NST1 n=1 Tax=Drosophila rhopaloa TaxID=1041015 RepID=A0A6P4EUN2_DRORH
MGTATRRTKDNAKQKPRLSKEVSKTKTAKGSKDNSKRYREKIKKDPIKFEEYRAREAERSRIYRRKLKEVVKKNKKVLKTKREIDRIRQQRYRDKKKEELEERKSKEEVLRKLERAMPSKMTQKIEVIKLLYNKYVDPKVTES